METYKQIPVAPDYEVSDLGNVRRLTAGQRTRVGLQRKPWALRGYQYVTLRVDNRPKAFVVHRLVMLAFVGPSNLQVNHINGDKADNRLVNLEYVTAHANRAHAKAALDAYPKGAKHPNSKLTEADVRHIFDLIDRRWSDRAIGAAIGCSGANVWMIRNGKAWAHLSERPRPPNYKGKTPL